MGLFDFKKNTIEARPGEIIFDKLNITNLNVYPVVNTISRTFALSIYRDIDDYAGDIVCFDYDVCDPELGGDMDFTTTIRKNIGNLLDNLNKEGRLELMINNTQTSPDIYSYSSLKVHVMKAIMCYFRQNDFKFKVYGCPLLYVSNIVESLLRSLNTTTKRYYVNIENGDVTVIHDREYEHLFVIEDMSLIRKIIAESKTGYIAVSTVYSFVDVVRNKIKNIKGDDEKMAKNKLSVEVKERIKSVLENQSVWELLGKELIEGTITMNVSRDLKLEIQEYDIILVDRKNGEVAESYATVDRALSEDRLFKFIDEYTNDGVTIDGVGTILIDGSSFDNDALGLWTDGSKFLYLEKYTNEIILCENKGSDIEAINTIDLADFEDYDEEYTDKFNEKLYMSIRNHLLSEEGKELFEELKSFLDVDGKNYNKYKELSRKVSLIGLETFESIGKTKISNIVSEFCSTRELDATFIVTEDKVVLLISREDEMDVLKDVETCPAFNNFESISVDMVKDILKSVDSAITEVLENK